MDEPVLQRTVTLTYPLTDVLPRVLGIVQLSLASDDNKQWLQLVNAEIECACFYIATLSGTEAVTNFMPLQNVEEHLYWQCSGQSGKQKKVGSISPAALHLGTAMAVAAVATRNANAALLKEEKDLGKDSEYGQYHVGLQEARGRVQAENRMISRAAGVGGGSNANDAVDLMDDHLHTGILANSHSDAARGVVALVASAGGSARGTGALKCASSIMTAQNTTAQFKGQWTQKMAELHLRAAQSFTSSSW
ncbi:hypothetical protein B484DRAFT_423282 [Ochromonadaceae sp. CCMP2298]|nr:hypothetical protein B484DRAFT_423282 [Ochromonadaceae sp. CCMP2298]